MNSSDLMEQKQSASGQMYQNLHQGHSSISRPTIPAKGRHLMLQGRSVPERSKIVLSTEAKPRLKWKNTLHDRFVEAVNQLGGADSEYSLKHTQFSAENILIQIVFQRPHQKQS